MENRDVGGSCSLSTNSKIDVSFVRNKAGPEASHKLSCICWSCKFPVEVVSEEHRMLFDTYSSTETRAGEQLDIWIFLS